MWKSINYEACGRSHIKSSIPCQDKTLACYINGVDIIALADGAGSAKLSHFGADIITKSICEYITENFEKLIQISDGRIVKQNILNHLLDKLQQKSDELSCDMKDLSTTLLVAAVRDNTFIILHIGDGVIGYLKNNELIVASTPQNGEFANTTMFITSDDALTNMRLLKGNSEDISGFIIMSDGTAESFYHKKNNSLASVIIKIMHRTTLLAHDKIFQMIKDSFDKIVITNTQDDCSIAVLSRNFGVLCNYSDMSLKQKCDLLSIISPCNNAVVKRIKRYDEIIYLLKSKKTSKQISKLIHLKEKYTKIHLKRLEEIGLISKEDGYYANSY